MFVRPANHKPKYRAILPLPQLAVPNRNLIQSPPYIYSANVVLRNLSPRIDTHNMPMEINRNS